MNRYAIVIALATLAAAGQSYAGPSAAFEGGAASSSLTFEPAVSGAPRSRAEVASEGREFALRLNSRSGQQTNVEQNNALRAVSTRSRADVRAEAIAAARGPQPAFEGGESTAQVQRIDGSKATTLLASAGKSSEAAAE